MKSTVLDASGATCIAAFAFFVWPPAALLVVGVACLVISWHMTRPEDDGDRQ